MFQALFYMLYNFFTYACNCQADQILLLDQGRIEGSGDHDWHILFSFLDMGNESAIIIPVNGF